MSLPWKLAVTAVVRRPLRFVLAAWAMAAASAAVVWVVSGYDAIVSQFGPGAAEYMGRYHLLIVADTPDAAPVTSEMLAALTADADVERIEAMLQWTVRAQPDFAVEYTASGLPQRSLSPRDGGGGRFGGDMGLGGPPGRSIEPSRDKDSGDRMPGPRRLPGSAEGDGVTGDRRVSGPTALTESQRPTAAAYGQPGGSRGRIGGLNAPMLLGVAAEQPPYELLDGRWLELGDPTRREAVVTKSLADSLGLRLSDELLVIFETKEYRLKIVGVLAGPAVAPTVRQRSPTGRPMMAAPGLPMGPAASAVYVPIDLARKIVRCEEGFNVAGVVLRDGADPSAFRARFTAQTCGLPAVASLVGEKEIIGALEEGMMAAGSRNQAWAATGMSLLAALFIIFTTLSMGVDERSRQFALLRAVGLTRWQVGRVIFVEGLLLALIGWIGGLGAGWALLALVGWNRPSLLGGASLGMWCVLMAGLSAFGGALVAGIVPAWRAMRASPLDAIAPRRAVRPSGLTVGTLALCGAALVPVHPLLVAAAPPGDAMRWAVYAAVGYTVMAVGFLLLAPAMVVVTETLLSPLAARLVGLDPAFLRSQLSSNLWRAVGAALALSVGLGLYVSMTVWGYTMLGPFTPGDWHPDMLAAIQSGGLPDSELDAIRRIEGVASGQCLPLAVEQPRLAADITDSRRGSSVTRQDNVIIIGLNPSIAFADDNPMLRVSFTAGTPAEARELLRRGRYCIVPDHFLAATGLRVGDRFSMVPPNAPGRSVDYTIAGAVSLPGWHWMTKFSGLRRRSGRSAAIVFADFDRVRRDFNIETINFLWINVDGQFGNAHLDQVRREAAAAPAISPMASARGPGAPPTRAAPEATIDAKRAAVIKVAEALQPIVERYRGEQQPVNAQGTWAFGATMFGPSLRVTTPAEVRGRLFARADDMIWAMCQFPLITLVITSLGVVGSVTASVRARQWELGVQRAVGVTRWGIFRIFILEGFMIGVVAGIISLCFGITAGWCGTSISQHVSFFGGMDVRLIIPWAKIGVGVGATLTLCALAAFWPAIAAARTEPLRLLQQGRGAM